MITRSDIARYRLHTQNIDRRKFEKPDQVAAFMGGVQAQEYAHAKWGIGIRWKGGTEAGIEGAIADGTIIRTWALRGTLHLVAASDVRWLLDLVAPAVIARQAASYRKLDLDDAVFERINGAITETLQGGEQLTRPELFAVLERQGIVTQGFRGAHILYRAAWDGVICLGHLRGKQPTYTLLDEWSPGARTLERDEALAELARRYFSSHGPATLQDFIWWSSLRATDARAGLEMARPWLCQETIDDQTYWLPRDLPATDEPSPTAHLLPGFDEYFLGYKDRSAVLDPIYTNRVATSNGIFSPVIVIDGQIIGTWKRTVKKGSVIITLEPFIPLKKAGKGAVVAAAERYGAFMELPVTLV